MLISFSRDMKRRLHSSDFSIKGTICRSRFGSVLARLRNASFWCKVAKNVTVSKLVFLMSSYAITLIFLRNCFSRHGRNHFRTCFTAERIRYPLRLDGSDQFGIINDVFLSEIPGERDDVSLVIHFDATRIQSIVHLADEWNGTIEAAVYISSISSWSLCMDVIKYLRACHANVKKLVNWHISFRLESLKCIPQNMTYLNEGITNCPQRINTILDILKTDTIQFGGSDTTWDHIANYPAAMMQNIAVNSSKSEFVLFIDSDIVPSEKLRLNFLEFARKKNLLGPAKVRKIGQSVGKGVRMKNLSMYENLTLNSVIENEENSIVCADHINYSSPPPDVYVIPTFQYKGDEIPRTLQQLMSAQKIGDISPFYETMYPPAYMPTNHKRWLRLADGGPVQCVYEVKYFLAYEPFIIVRRDMPQFDERFSGHAFIVSNQHASLAAAGYKFKVLKSVFLVHPGWKSWDFLSPQKNLEIERGFPKWYAFLDELDKTYHN